MNFRCPTDFRLIIVAAHARGEAFHKQSLCSGSVSRSVHQRQAGGVARHAHQDGHAVAPIPDKSFLSSRRLCISGTRQQREGKTPKLNVGLILNPLLSLFLAHAVHLRLAGTGTQLPTLGTARRPGRTATRKFFARGAHLACDLVGEFGHAF